MKGASCLYLCAGTALASWEPQCVVKTVSVTKTVWVDGEDNIPYTTVVTWDDSKQNAAPKPTATQTYEFTYYKDCTKGETVTWDGKTTKLDKATQWPVVTTKTWCSGYDDPKGWPTKWYEVYTTLSTCTPGQTVWGKHVGPLGPTAYVLPTTSISTCTVTATHTGAPKWDDKPKHEDPDHYGDYAHDYPASGVPAKQSSAAGHPHGGRPSHVSGGVHDDPEQTGPMPHHPVSSSMAVSMPHDGTFPSHVPSHAPEGPSMSSDMHAPVHFSSLRFSNSSHVASHVVPVASSVPVSVSHHDSPHVPSSSAMVSAHPSVPSHALSADPSMVSHAPSAGHSGASHVSSAMHSGASHAPSSRGHVSSHASSMRSSAVSSAPASSSSAVVLPPVQDPCPVGLNYYVQDQTDLMYAAFTGSTEELGPYIQMTQMTPLTATTFTFVREAGTDICRLYTDAGTNVVNPYTENLNPGTRGGRVLFKNAPGATGSDGFSPLPMQCSVQQDLELICTLDTDPVVNKFYTIDGDDTLVLDVTDSTRVGVTAATLRIILAP